MKLNRCIRTDELEAMIVQMEEILGLELSVVSPEGDVLAGRLLTRAGVEEVPIQVGGAAAGFLRCRGPGERSATVKSAARFISTLVERDAESRRATRELMISLAQTWKELQFLYELGASLRVNMDLQQTCDLILDQLVRLMGVARASILLFGADGHLYIQAARGIPAEVVARTRIRVGEGIAGWVARTERPILVEDVRIPPPEMAGLVGKASEVKGRSFLSVPLHLSNAFEGGSSRGRLVGVLNLTDRRDDESFTESDLHLATAVGAQAAVAIENCLLAVKARQAEKVHEQLEVAGRLQAALVPDGDPAFEGLDVSGRREAASSLIGDYYDFFNPEPGTFEAVVAESSAHGVSAALLLSSVRASIRTLASLNLAPGAMAEHLNRLLCSELGGTGMFVSACFLRYERARSLLRYAGAGQGRQLLCLASGEIIRLSVGGMAAGVVAGTSYPESQCFLRPGDVLALFTDGLPEARSASGEEFGFDRLADLVSKNRHLPARQISRAVLAAVREFSEGAAEQDDRTLVVIKVRDSDEPA
jgi:sigma-B regulation protein RsbU (phosphoserine phosphatase)